MTYTEFVESKALVLDKIIEHKQNRTLEFYFRSREFMEPSQLAFELQSFFPFVDHLKVHLQELKENPDPPQKKDILSESKDENTEKEDFSFEEYQKKKLLKKSKEIKEYVPPKKKAEKNSVETVVLKPGDMLCGKPFEKDPIPIGEIDFSDTIHQNGVCFEGTVFQVEKKEISEKSVLYTIALTDYTGSIFLKKFVQKNKEKELNIFDQYFKKGNSVKVFGNIEYDDFVKDKVLKLIAAQLLEPNVRKDTSEEKRVELHMHTQYSAVDAVSKVGQIIQRAKDFGHKTIGITDHGVLQAYPDLQKQAKGAGIKVLYGLEGYLVDTGTKIVKGIKDSTFDQEFVFFDLETTGTSVYTDKVIEIAAVIVKNGEIRNTYQTFVNPHQKLPPKITELTGITDQMASQGVEEDEGFQGLIDFIGDRIIAAHNATFDTAFLNRWLKKTGTSFEYTVIDTLPLARAVVPEVARYNMGRLCSFFKIKNQHAHRAIDDSIASAKVMNELFKRAEDRNVFEVQKLNTLLDMESMAKRISHTNHVTIYAKNQKGLHDLYELVSDSHLKYFNNRPRIPKEVLAEKRENLLIGSACSSGELFEAILDKAPDDVLLNIASFYDYLEVMPIENNRYLIFKNPSINEETLRNFNRKIIEIGEKANIPVVATGDVHFVDPQDHIFREIIKYKQARSSKGVQPPLYYRNTQEMIEEFNYLSPEKAFEIVVTNTNKIADLIDDVKPVPDGTFPPIIEGSEQELREKCESKAHEIYGEQLPEIVEKRMERELSSIIDNGYSVLYIIAQKLVQHSEEDGYLVGSRGSVGSSFAAMLCGITEVNSLPPHYVCPKCKHSEFIEGQDLTGPDLEDKDCPVCATRMKKDGYDIPFETFLGFEGDKEPDIDLNFSGDNQGAAHAFTEELFGEGKTFRAGTISTIAEQTAFGYVRSYLDDIGKTVSKAEMERLKEGCTGIKKTTGQHPGGIMVVPRDRDICEFTPVQHPADDVNSDTITTHFDYHSISGRLLKLDILGHDDPTMLRKLQNLTHQDPRKIPLDDKKVISLFTDTSSLDFKTECSLKLGTSGIPEFGTPFTKQMVMDIKPKHFSDLVKISGLSHGTDVWTNNAQTLIRNKTATIKEVICTRDDIMLGLINMGLPSKDSFTIMECVRKGKGLTPEQEKEMRDHKVPEWYINSCKTIKYMFPKAHAVAYVVMAFRIAWYKINYPLAYYACFFGIRAKEFDLKTIISGKEAIETEIKRLEDLHRSGELTNKEKDSLTSLELALEMYCRGYECKPIDLKKSHYSDFVIDGNSIIPPFTSVSGLGEAAAKSLYDVIHGEGVLSQEELLEKTKLTKTNLASLEEVGCLSELPKSNQVTFFNF